MPRMNYDEWLAERRREAITGLTDLDTYDPDAASLRALYWQTLLSARRNERGRSTGYFNSYDPMGAA